MQISFPIIESACRNYDDENFHLQIDVNGIINLVQIKSMGDQSEKGLIIQRTTCVFYPIYVIELLTNFRETKLTECK